jgi:NitT/TauT family transport system substrate-binding protein
MTSDNGRIMRLINKLLYGLAATIPVVALAGCSAGGSGTSTSTGPLESTSIVIDAVPTADAAGLYIAYDDGLFAKQGLKVTIAPINGGEYGMGDLQTGKAQLVEGNYVSFILAQVAGKFAAPVPTNPTKTLPSKPIDMRIIADASQMQPGNQALYVMPGSPFKTVKQVAKAHAKVGVNSLNNIGSVLLGSLLTANGYPLNSVHQTPEILPDMPSLLSKHVIPAAWLPEPFGTEAEEQYGAVPLADFDQGSLQNFPIGTIVGSAQWVKTHPNTIAAFLRAYAEGQQIADTDRSAVEQALVTNTSTHVTPLVAANMTLDTYPLAMDVPVMQRVADAMYQFGVLTKHYDITDMIQPEPGETGGQ